MTMLITLLSISALLNVIFIVNIILGGGKKKQCPKAQQTVEEIEKKIFDKTAELLNTIDENNGIASNDDAKYGRDTSFIKNDRYTGPVVASKGKDNCYTPENTTPFEVEEPRADESAMEQVMNDFVAVTPTMADVKETAPIGVVPHIANPFDKVVKEEKVSNIQLKEIGDILTSVNKAEETPKKRGRKKKTETTTTKKTTTKKKTTKKTKKEAK